MDIEPGEHSPLRWYQFRLSFLLLIVPFMAVAMSLFEPMADTVGHWFAGPYRGGKAVMQQESSSSYATLNDAYHNLHWPKDSAKIISIYDHAAKLESSVKIDAEGKPHPSSSPPAGSTSGPQVE
jgi:hypothetical protein